MVVLVDPQADRRSDVQSVRRALALLKAFSPSRSELGVGEAARLIGVHTSSASRLLATLADAGFVRQDAVSGRYRPGFAALELAGLVMNSLDIRTEALGTMRDLSKTVGETVNLSVLDGAEAVIIEQAAVASTVRYVSWIGRRIPLHATAHGRAHLGFLPDEQRESLIASIATDGRFPTYTPGTVATLDALRHELQLVRQRGYAISSAELDLELAGVAVPILNYTGSVVASMSISGPSYRLPIERLHQLAELATAAGREISTQLGWNPSRTESSSLVWSTTNAPAPGRPIGRAD